MLSRPVLVYDGDCGFCRDWVRRLSRWDRADAIRKVPARDRGQVAGLPHLSDASLARAMHFVTPEGAVYLGARALPPLLPYLPGGILLAPLLRIPGAQPLADRIYRWIADRRHRFGCGSDRCGI